MNWLSQNWIWLLFALAFVAMHLFGHGSHGGHGGGGDRHRHGGKDSKRDDVPPAGHKH